MKPNNLEWGSFTVTEDDKKRTEEVKLFCVKGSLMRIQCYRRCRFEEVLFAEAPIPYTVYGTVRTIRNIVSPTPYPFLPVFPSRLSPALTSPGAPPFKIKGSGEQCELCSDPCN